MYISIVGVGYIGLPTATILANSGHNVYGIDINTSLINQLNNRTYSTEEKDLLNYINMSMDNNKLSFMTSIQKSDIFIICTPTPLDENNDPDLNHLFNALDNTLEVIETGNLIIIESTIPPGTIKNKVIPLIEEKGFIIGKDILLAYCPERVIPNNIIYEIINNNRVIGACTENCAVKTKEVYNSFIKGELLIVKPEIAELVKLIENSYRYLNIAFANELAKLCNQLELDPYLVINISNKHPRVNILQPGIGVGGHCLPVDSQFLISQFKDTTELISLSHEINKSMPFFIAERIELLVKDITDPKITIWGISYKGNSSDTRDSPSLKIYNILKEKEFDVEIWDPYLNDNNKLLSLHGSNLLMVLVNHDEIMDFEYNIILNYMDTPIIFDGVNVIDPASLNPDITIIKLGNL